MESDQDKEDAIRVGKRGKYELSMGGTRGTTAAELQNFEEDDILRPKTKGKRSLL